MYIIQSIPSGPVFIDGQIETDINKIKQMVDKHLHMKIHVVIDLFLFHSLLPSIAFPQAIPSYSGDSWSLFRAKKYYSTLPAF